MLERTWSALCVLLLAGFAHAALATVCPGPAPSPPPVGVCSAQAGPGTFLLVEGTLLLPDEVLENGDVLVDQFGRIACAACDCSGEPGYATATRVSCPQGVVSPGLIDLTQALTYQSNPVTPDTGERYEHREDWRRGENGHTQFEVTPTNTVAHAHYAELRALLAGVTTLNGNRTSALPGFTRGFDTLDATAMGETRIDNERFPLGSTPVQQVGTCDYPQFPGAPPPDRTRILTIAEGIAPSSLNEWHCLNGSTVDGVDAIEAAPIAGLLALDAADGDLLYRRGASMIWTPRHAVRTFGHPGPVAAFHRVGVPITLGTMWSVSGSFQMLREMQCAADLDDTYLGGVFGTPGVWRMATVNAARALRADGSIGVIAPGRLADLVVFDARVRSGHEAVVRAETADVVLVMRAGLALYGESGPMATLGRPAPDCEALDVCGSPRLLCVQEEIGMSLGALTASVSPNPMPLFACGVPADEPTCIPSRPVPVNGSTVYSGIITGADADGDGIPDASDNCPTVFNPVRPVDDGVQSDVDGDGFGDECDLCPIEPGNQPCVRGVFRDGFE